MVNHNPICSCAHGYTGDPFSRCYKPAVEIPKETINPCVPTPCGPNADCKVVGESPACSCLPNYFGAPPHCRPECTINSECPSNRACMNQRCIDPCPGSCGINTQCSVINHTPSCTCNEHYTGDPFQGCSPIQGKYNFYFYFKNRTQTIQLITPFIMKFEEKKLIFTNYFFCSMYVLKKI